MLLDEEVDFIEEGREPLDFVDDDDTVSRFEAAADHLRAGGELTKSVGFEEAVKGGAGKGGAGEGGFAGLASTE